MDIEKQLCLLQDGGYRLFQQKLIPSVPPERIIGVRTPALRKMARVLISSGEAEDYLKKLPHRYFEEDQLHAFILSEERDYGRLVEELDRFLPYIDNWATCDQLLPKVFSAHRDRLDGEVVRWMSLDDVYAVRFAIGIRMKHFLGTAYKADYLDEVAAVKREEYYIKMMVAWFFATAADGHYEEVLRILRDGKLDRFTHNKTISKAIESHRIPITRKEELRRLRR